MPTIQVRDMDATTEYFVATCTHVNESDETDAVARRRVRWFRDMHNKGSRVKVALLDEKQIGFLYVMPIEMCPWGPLGVDLMVIPCLVVLDKEKNQGAGSALVAAAEEEARRQGKKGIVTTGFYSDFWFMPAPFFEKLGFSVAGDIRKVTAEGQEEYLNKEALLWKAFDSTAQPPQFLKPSYRFQPVPGKVVVDLFWNTFCATSNGEAQRVREVAAEFGDSVVLNEYSADDPATFQQHQMSRGIFVNGKEVGWGYEAPRDGIRKAISDAVGKNKP
ncbi:MAG: GNAT family N-acetyltransferase [Candidatus Zixiibacteriota bacterium]|nr:MAG: GNAT family N-acetyltransferase [candidate division Zixibacteria bacterium]